MGIFYFYDTFYGPRRHASSAAKEGSKRLPQTDAFHDMPHDTLDMIHRGSADSPYIEGAYEFRLRGMRKAFAHGLPAAFEKHAAISFQAMAAVYGDLPRLAAMEN